MYNNYISSKLVYLQIVSVQISKTN